MPGRLHHAQDAAPATCTLAAQSQPPFRPSRRCVQEAQDHHAVVLLDSDVVSVDIWQLVNWPSRWERAVREMGAGKALVLPAFQLTPAGVAAAAKRGEAVEVGAMRTALKVVTAGERGSSRAQPTPKCRRQEGPALVLAGPYACAAAWIPPCRGAGPSLLPLRGAPCACRVNAGVPRPMVLAAEAGKFPLKELFKAGKAGVYADHGFASSQAAALPVLWFEAGAPSPRPAVPATQCWVGRTPGYEPKALPPSMCPALFTFPPSPASVCTPQVTCTARTTTATPSCRSPALRPLS